MKVVPLSAEGLRVGRPLPFALRDGAGIVLLARGVPIHDDKQLEQLRARPIFIDAMESEAVQRAYAGQLDQMLRQEVALGRIASTRPDYDVLNHPAAAPRPADRPLDWPNLQMRLRLLLVDPRGADWIGRLRAVRDDVLTLLERHPDRALMRLLHDASNDFQDYSANHALLVCVLVSLSCEVLPGWQDAWRDPLTLAALTMNISFTAVQDELARQSSPPGEAQQAAMREHPERSADLLASLGVDCPLWLQAVRAHHAAPPGPLAGRAPQEMMARLVRRADRYAARLSPRRSRPASSATAAAQAALLDEGGHTDEAGQALIRALGLYPPGLWVKLQCGEVALVLRRSPSAKTPVVVSLVGKAGLPLAVPAVRNTRQPNYEVVAALPPTQVRVRPNFDVLDKLG